MIYSPEGNSETLSFVAQKIKVPEAVLCSMNNLYNNSVIRKEILVPNSAIRSVSGTRLLNVGDLFHFNLDLLSEQLENPLFLIQYYTVKGIALGKLTLTDYEIIFEPLNPQLKGFVDPMSNLSRRQFI
jgi:hypothetical protein